MNALEQEATERFRAFHSFPDLGIAGVKPQSTLAAEAAAVFAHGVAGKTVLDIGAWDGWFSFDAEKRGASAVTATDWFCWGGPGWGTDDVFEHVRSARKSNVHAIECDIPDLTPAAHGQYDIVLLLGVLYHVQDMRGILDRAQALAHEQVVIETQTIPSDEPVARYWTGDSLGGDGSNFWTPSVTCVTDMMREFGFKRFEAIPTPLQPQTADLTRHVIHAWR